jgi:prepilin-type N-terminal cleavage/methylation domain-containing protein
MPTQNGFSLIELLIVMGIMSIAALGMMSMMDNQNKDFRFLAEKFEIRDTKSVLTGVLDENSFCGCFLNGKTFNTTTGLMNQAITSIPMNYTSPSPTCTPSTLNIIPPVGSKLSASSNITVASLSLLPGTEVVPGSGKYSSGVEVTLGNVSRSVRPITVPIFFKIDTAAGTPTTRPVTNCMSATVEVPPLQGFCTPMNRWDNGNTLSCPAISGFTMRRITGVDRRGTDWRGSGCCYIPNTDGGNGWCSPAYPNWGPGDFSGCGAGTALFSVTQIFGVKSGESNYNHCCFVPNFMPKYPQAFATGTLTAWDAHSPNCGGPFTYFNTVFQNTVTGGQGHEISCTYIPK